MEGVGDGIKAGRAMAVWEGMGAGTVAGHFKGL
jgi:hypothetical protein